MSRLLNIYFNNIDLGPSASLAKSNLQLPLQYVFFDEVSMLSARDLYCISNQLSQIFDTSEDSFGGLDIVFAGDFAQLPLAVGGEGVSLYSHLIVLQVV